MRLALDAGDASCGTDRLIDDLWADRRGRHPAQHACSRRSPGLRRALGDPAVLVGSTDGYVLAVDPRAVDAFAVADDATASARLLLSR